MNANPKAGKNVPATALPFGKHEGRLIEEVILDDPQYLRWLSAQEWFRTKHTSLYQIIINRGSVPEETPEHNALQVLFLEDQFCERFARCADKAFDATVDKEVRQRANSFVNTPYALLQNLHAYRTCAPDYPPLVETKCKLAEIQKQQLERYEARGAIELRFEREFEVRGLDVVLEVRAYCPGWGETHHVALHNIELKPTVGDDYPAVLRQMKANGSRYLLLKEYVGTGATREQFIKTFATADKAVIFLNECTAVLAG